jgi:hypothetical protein
MRVFLTLLLTLLTATSSWAESCPFSKWTSYRSSTLLRHTTGAYVFATAEVKVDADGAPNAYHPDDARLDCRKGSGFKGLDCPGNAGYPKGDWWNVLVRDPAVRSRPYVQPPGSVFPGFFVSMTSLRDGTKPATDTTSYVDARTVPYLVFPGSFSTMKGTGIVGDVGYATNTSNGKRSPFIVAETGPPSALLGEMSIALGSALGGTNPNPRTGAGAPKGKIVYVVFPRSAASPRWPLTNEALTTRVDGLLSRVGGIQAVEACTSAL